VEGPLTVSFISYRHFMRAFHNFSDTKLPHSVKISIFCEIRFSLREAKKWFYGGILIAAP